MIVEEQAPIVSEKTLSVATTSSKLSNLATMGTKMTETDALIIVLLNRVIIAVVSSANILSAKRIVHLLSLSVEMENSKVENNVTTEIKPGA